MGRKKASDVVPAVGMRQPAEPLTIDAVNLRLTLRTLGTDSDYWKGQIEYAKKSSLSNIDRGEWRSAAMDVARGLEAATNLERVTAEIERLTWVTQQLVEV